MRRYIAGRLLSTIPTLFGVITLVFIVMRLVPGTIVDQILANGDSSEEVQRSLRAFFGLDRPLYVQYLNYVGSLLTGDLGVSWRARFPALDMILYALPVTLELALLAALVSMVVGIGFGVLSAVNENTLLDHVIRVLSLFSLSMPVFWQATMLILVLSTTVRWAPLGYIDPFTDLWGNLALMALPAICLGTSASASVMRMTRSCLLDVLRQDYIRTAEAKGLRYWAVVVRHGVKNAMIPVVTILGLQVGSLLGGSVVVESVFGLPGIGLLILNAIGMRDYPIVQGAVIVTAVLFMATNLLVDLLYGYLDPRIRYGRSGAGGG
ncbi:MAG: ABC transporter permease [Chloroflexi bacterium]|nr:ABC transporter permease [Chloroflexota bacterium]